MTAETPPIRPPRTGRLRLWARRLVWIAAIVYLIAGILVFAFQDMMVFPGAQTQGTAEAIIYPTPGVEVLHLTAHDGTPIVAMFAPALTDAGQPAANRASAPTVLFFYGNGMCASQCENLLAYFRNLDCNVIIPDYPGYGMSGGKVSEQGCYAAADAAYDALLARTDVDPHRFIAAGWSLGGAVAIDLASRRPVMALATFSAFTSMRAMAGRIVPWLPTAALLKYRFDNQVKIAGLKVPIFMAHGDDDTLIPSSMMDQLHAAARSPVTAVHVPGAGHADIFEVGVDSTMERLKSFIDAVNAGQN